MNNIVLTALIITAIISFLWGMLATMVIERLSCDRFISIFFPEYEDDDEEDECEIVMTTFHG